MSSGIESFFAKYQQLSNYAQNVARENHTPGTLETASLNSSNVASKLVNSLDTQSQGTLFVPFLGQSNAQFMSTVFNPYQPGSTDNDTSGAIVLDTELSSFIGTEVITSDTQETNFAVGGSRVNGNGDYQNYDNVWWYPGENKPGGALLQAERGLNQWLADKRAQQSDEIAIVWSQGESDVGNVSSSNPDLIEEYKQSTLAVFDYLQENLGYDNISFYIVPTGRLQTEAAANNGLSADAIESMQKGLEIIRDVQGEIALERDDVKLAPDYSDLNMVYEEAQIYGESYDQPYERWSTDFWHLGHDGLKVNGTRLAQYIALERGQNNVISFTDSFGNSAESVSITRDGLLDINTSDNYHQGVIQGTDNPDVMVGTTAADEILGGNSNDVIVSGRGIDTLAGGAGNDVFFYKSVHSDSNAHYDRISDFVMGSDRIDVSEPLSGYTGDDPVGDGYVMVRPWGDNGTEVKFDPDGYGEQPAHTLAVIENVEHTKFESDLNGQFIFTPTEF